MKYFLLVLFVVSIGIQAIESQQFTGRIISENNEPLSNVKVGINGQYTMTESNGRYSLTVSNASIFQLTITHQNFYQAIRTYSSSELLEASNTIVDIELVSKKQQRVMLAFGGDVMMGRRYYKPYFGDAILINPDSKLSDSMEIVRHIKPYMGIADYAAVNLETQITDTKPSKRAPKSVTFFSQPETLEALHWAGVDYVSLGNNHTYDYLDEGLTATVEHLKNSPLAYSGAGVNEQEALKAHRETINQSEFSMLGYVGWEGSANPSQTANALHGGAAYGSMENIISAVEAESSDKRNTIVQYHGSQEYANEPTGVTEQRLKSALDAGASVAIAHHPHVTQGIELYNNKLIAYSMGNFIFDQNFSATQYSFILYIWLDDGEFHRAEIVPIYVKGYKPTPAIDSQRTTVMRRIKSLSAARNTLVTNSAGHGVINRVKNLPPAKFKSVSIDFNNETTSSLESIPWSGDIQQIVLPNDNLKYRLGKNMVNDGDFENFSSFDSPERGLLFDRSASTINHFGFNSNRSIGLSVKPENTQLFGMQSFKRVYRASTPVTIKARVQTNEPISVNLYWQGRKTRQKLFDAFKNSPKHLIKTISLAQGEHWQTIESQFNSPRIGYKSYRVLAEIVNNSGEVTEVNIDDFSVIEWHTAFSNLATPTEQNHIDQQASFIGLNQPTTQSIHINYK